MVNIPKHIEYWKESAREDFAVAEELVEKGRHRHGLFFAHLAFEKLLKAHVCKNTTTLAPKIHDLIRLVKLAELDMPEPFIDVLADMNDFNLEGRYPVSFAAPMLETEARKNIIKATEVFEWLMKQL
ncbi:MAG: HEPN domain-containing protein [Sedimentisphaerales bacterium]|nr:HEPN domain-containing protein [Sedimentisphaerales bacterium]